MPGEGLRLLIESCTTYHEMTDPRTNQVSSVGIVNKAELRELRKKRRQEGRELLAPWEAWMILDHGCADRYAKNARALVWLSLWETRGNPMQKVLDDSISKFTRQTLKSYLRMFCIWMLERRDSSPEEHIWARNLLNELAAHPLRNPRILVHTPEDRGTAARYSEQAIERLRQALVEVKKTHGVRFPGVWPVISALITLGIERRVILAISHTDVDLAHDKTQRGDKDVVLRSWVAGKGRAAVARSIPAELVLREIATWHAWPAPWANVSDTLSDTQKSRPVLQWMTEIWHRAGLGPPDIHAMRKLRNAAIRRIMVETRDRIMVQHLYRLKYLSMVDEIVNSAVDDD